MIVKIYRQAARRNHPITEDAIYDVVSPLLRQVAKLDSNMDLFDGLAWP